jgi:hypothetical protein
LQAGPRIGWFDAKSDRRRERVGLRLKDFEGGAAANGTLDAHRRRLAEADIEPEVVGERCLDDLLLDLAIERDRYLVADVVLADVDQRILLGQLVQRDAKCAAVNDAPRNDNCLQRRRREVLAFA